MTRPKLFRSSRQGGLGRAPAGSGQCEYGPNHRRYRVPAVSRLTTGRLVALAMMLEQGIDRIVTDARLVLERATLPRLGFCWHGADDHGPYLLGKRDGFRGGIEPRPEICVVAQFDRIAGQLGQFQRGEFC